jgi:hypothetical protein
LKIISPDNILDNFFCVNAGIFLTLNRRLKIEPIAGCQPPSFYGRFSFLPTIIYTGMPADGAILTPLFNLFFSL